MKNSIYTVATPCINKFLESLIKPKIIEIITYRIIEHTRTLMVVTVPNKSVTPCSFKNSKYVKVIP